MAIASPQVLPLIPGTGNDAVDWTISTPGTFTGFWASDLAGAEVLQGQIRFFWGTGSGGVRVCLQSSMDQGNTAYDVALFEFAAVSKTYVFQVSPGTSGIVLPGEGGLDAVGGNEADGIITSILGERFRLKVIVLGTYVNTTLSARIIAS